MATKPGREKERERVDKVLFWDFHGTLIYPDKLWSRSIHRAILSLWPEGSITLEQVSSCQEKSAFPWDHPEQDYRHLTKPSDWWAHMGGMFYKTCRRCGLSDSEAIQVIPRVRGLLLEPANFRLYDDAVSTIQALTEDGWRHIMLSNNFPELADLCDSLGIGRYFDDFIISAQVGFDKPRTEIFDMARARAGFPDCCVMIGDNPVADIVGARLAGMKSVLVHQFDETAEHTCARLSDLVPLLRSSAFG